MKSLYDDDDQYIEPDCQEFVAEIKAAVEPIIKKWHKDGFSFRDLSNEARKAILEIELWISFDSINRE